LGSEKTGKMMTLNNGLTWLSIGGAAFAALFWWVSATVRLPERVTVGFGGAGGTAQELGEAVRRQSRWSAAAAIAAGVAAAAQGVATGLVQISWPT
jgi:hypothetical protein